jgi:hypothetical protein
MEPFSLTQGKYFITNKSYKESFTMPNIRHNTTNVATTDPAMATTDPATSTTDDTQEAINLQTQMEDLLTRLQSAQTDQASFTDKFSTSVNANNTNTNTYLNKNIHFSNVDRYGYVTNQSELKMYTSNDLFEKNKGKHGCPSDYIESGFNFPTDPVPKLGQSIETNISGVFVALGLPITKLGESCGYEGQNVYVNKLITNTNATYQGCYADDNNWKTMSFIGGSPPVEETFITNKNFSQSHLANDSYKYLTWDTITVPGWNFNCVLVNNSTAWGYPIPYPNGNQCACIQTTQELWTANWMSFSSGVTYTISFDACGRNCCDGSGEANPINIGLEDNTFYSFNPPVNKWTNYSTTFTVDSQQNMRLSFKGTWTASDRSTAIQNVSINKGASSNSGGTYTYDMCKQAAIDNGYQYFALQDVNTEKKTGYCAVANNNIWPTRYGESKIPESTTAIWSSKTTKNVEISGSGGKYAKLTSTGSLAVYNATDAVIFTTTIPEDQTSGYIGCYADRSSRAMPNISNNKYIEIEDCHQLAIDNNLKYYALQDVKQARDENNNLVGIGWCAGSNDLSQSQKYGKANCGPMSSTDNRIGGRGWSNAIYSTSPDSPHYLILQADGNMCIYKGSRIFNQGIVWDSMQDTENIIGEYKLQDPNPSKSAAMGTFKRNYITNDDDQILEVGDFIGSPDGSTFLIMQDDGNLVLYTTKLVTNCLKLDSNNYEDINGGGIGANALYKLDEVAFPDNMGKNGYVNGGSRVSEFPADMMMVSYGEPIQNKIGKNVQMIPGYNWTDGDVDPVKNIAIAKTACDNESTCNMILTHTSIPGKYLIATGSTTELNDANAFTSILKTNTLDTTQINSTCNKQPPIGIDTIQWEHYLKGLPMTKDTKCSIGKLESLKGKTIADLNAQLTDVSSKLIAKLNKIEDKNNKMNAQMDVGGKQIRIDVKKYKANAQKILTYSKSMNPRRKNGSQTLEGFNVLNNNIDYMVSDSNIISNQGVYSYIIWSVIATVIVIITIELFTNERNTPLWKLVFLAVVIIIMNGLFHEYALLVNIIIVLMFVIRKKVKLMAKENNNV